MYVRYQVVDLAKVNLTEYETLGLLILSIIIL